METETEEKVCLEIQNVKVQPSNWRAFSEDLKIDIGFNSSREIKGAYWKITFYTDAACYQKEIQNVSSELHDIAPGPSSTSIVLPGVTTDNIESKALWGTGYLVIKLIEKSGTKRKAEEEEDTIVPEQPQEEFNNLIQDFKIKGMETNEEDRGQVALVVNIRCKDKIWYRNIYTIF